MAKVEVRTDTLVVGEDEVVRLAALLDVEEQARAARFRFDAHRRRFIVRRGRAREWLSEITGRAPETLQFSTGPHGKPELPGGPCFSLSHSGETMMMAVSDAEVGCDIEREDAVLDWRPLAEGFFAPGEVAALSALPAPEARRAFFACWARKEAFVKALGLGLSYPLDAFEVSVDEEARLVSGGEGWTLTSSELDGIVPDRIDVTGFTAGRRERGANRLAGDRRHASDRALRAAFENTWDSRIETRRPETCFR